MVIIFQNLLAITKDNIVFQRLSFLLLAKYILEGKNTSALHVLCFECLIGNSYTRFVFSMYYPCILIIETSVKTVYARRPVTRLISDSSIKKDVKAE